MQVTIGGGSLKIDGMVAGPHDGVKVEAMAPFIGDVDGWGEGCL